ncbi:MAG: O-antigen ligase family protein [Ruminococcus sp.]|nr:O-antigen ligase family protein [Ruminococcus sp.]
MAKELFNSSEKSNFILNMTEEQYAKLASAGMYAACFAVPLFTILPEVSEKASFALSTGGLAVAGVFAMILALIALMKKYITGKAILPVAAFGFVTLWGLVSMIAGFDFAIGLYGFTGRGEGFLALLFYFSFFTMAAAVKRSKALSSLVWGMTLSGLLNGIFGVIQVFVGKPSYYKFADLHTRINAAAGLSHSPLFLAFFMTLAITAALFGMAFFPEKCRKAVSAVAVCIMSFVMVFTYSFIGWCGLGLSLIALFVAVFAAKAPKKLLAMTAGIALPAVLGVVLVNCGAIGNISSYRLYDGRILWWADSYIRLSASGDLDSDNLDIDDTLDVYSKLNSKAIRLIDKDPLTGTGPDQMIFPQIYKTDFGDDTERDLNDVIALNKGSFDRVYNEYLNAAVTRGVLSAVGLGVLLISVIAGGFAAAKKRRSWETVCLLTVTVWGALLFLICCSSMAFAPVLWCCAGGTVAALAKKDRA